MRHRLLAPAHCSASNFSYFKPTPTINNQARSPANALGLGQRNSANICLRVTQPGLAETKLVGNIVDSNSTDTHLKAGPIRLPGSKLQSAKQKQKLKEPFTPRGHSDPQPGSAAWRNSVMRCCQCSSK